MCCDSTLHDELKNMGEPTCPFCDRLLVEAHKAAELCCSEHDMENVNSMYICMNCGSVHGCDYVTEYLDFYDNMHKIRQKSVYYRKYHVKNVLDSISSEKNIQLTYHQRERIYKAFVEIGSVLNEVNDERKRTISIKYVIKQLFKMLGLPYKDINVTKSKRTLKYYEQYWKRVQSLIGNRIQSIINA